MNKIEQEIRKVKKAGGFGQTKITRITVTGGHVNMFVHSACYSKALEKLQKIAKRNNAHVFITQIRAKTNEIQLRVI